jgi:hypothetical protein
MQKLLATAALALVAAPALAEPSCAPAEAPKPVWEALKSFEEEGGSVIAFKINDGGCYEVYGTLEDQKYEVFFDPATGAEIERIES